MAEEEDWQSSGEAIKPEYFEHPTEGYISYDPNTLAINPRRQGHRPINYPISLPGKFWGTRQPFTPTCGEPREGHAGCSKWYGCKIGQMFAGVGPVNVRMKKHGTVSFDVCTAYFETTRDGKTTSQLHNGIDGWKLDTSDTTHPMLGRTWAIKAGLLNEESSREKVIATKPRVSWEEIPNLGPPWWSKMVEKGLELPEIAKKFPRKLWDKTTKGKKSA